MKARPSTVVLALASLPLVASVAARAQQAPASPPQSTAAGETLEEIIITARRKEENLQTVPESVAAVTSQDIEKFNITQFQEVAKLVPGLQLNFQAFAADATLRGVSSGVGTEPATLQQYLNDVAVDTTVLFASQYDVGQVEVLRGPQGTIRGKIAETGALTTRTRRPDLEDIGGYGSVTVGNQNNSNVQGAVGFPLIQDKLGIRFAAIRDENDAGGVRSISNNAAPRNVRTGGRVTTEFTPIPTLDAVISYQHIYYHQQFFMGPLFGSGYPGGTVPGQTYSEPAGYNGPTLIASQRLSVQPGLNDDKTKFNDVEGKIAWTFAGQTLTYVGGWVRYSFDIRGDADATNTIPG